LPPNHVLRKSLPSYYLSSLSRLKDFGSLSKQVKSHTSSILARFGCVCRPKFTALSESVLRYLLVLIVYYSFTNYSSPSVVVEQWDSNISDLYKFYSSCSVNVSLYLVSPPIFLNLITL